MTTAATFGFIGHVFARLAADFGRRKPDRCRIIEGAGNFGRGQRDNYLRDRNERKKSYT